MYWGISFIEYLGVNKNSALFRDELNEVEMSTFSELSEDVEPDKFAGCQLFIELHCLILFLIGLNAVWLSFDICLMWVVGGDEI
jgi:hypothetical protein